MKKFLSNEELLKLYIENEQERGNLRRKLAEKAMASKTKEEADKAYDNFIRNGFLNDEMPLDFLKNFYYEEYRQLLQSL